jgi:hypothetical protein
VGVNLQATTKEHNNNTKLAATAHGEVLQLPQRENDHNQIENDVNSSRRPSVGIQVDTSSVVLAIPSLPGIADGKALQSSGCDERNHVQYAKYYGDVDRASKALLWEDAEVKQQDGDLSDCDRRKI